jgi:hypothetical protein
MNVKGWKQHSITRVNSVVAVTPLESVLNRLKALRAEGLGFDRTAARMNEEQIPTRTGRPWHGVVINRILTGKR